MPVEALVTASASPEKAAEASWAAEPQNHTAYCYVSGGKVYLRSKTSWSIAALIGIP